MEGDVLYTTVPSNTLKAHIQQKFLAVMIAILNDITNNEEIDLIIDVESDDLAVSPVKYAETPLFKDDSAFISNMNRCV